MPDRTRAADEPIDQRIMAIYSELTPSERQLAEVVLQAQATLSSYTAAELAERAGVSAPTAARFFKRLGYRNYGEARLHSRREAGWASPLQHLATRERGTGGDFRHHVAQDAENLSRSAETLDPALMARAETLLAEAARIWVVGFRNSRALAHYAHMLLLNLREDVHLLPRDGMSLGEDVVGFAPGDVVLVVAMRRRPRVLARIVGIAADAGAATIVIGDPTLGETVRRADVTFRCHNRGSGVFDSMVVPLSLINHLCAALVDRGGDAVRARLERIEAMHVQVDDLGPPRRRRNLPKDAAGGGA